MATEAGSETNPEVVQALYDLEVAKGQRILAGEKKDVNFSRLERGRVGANPRDEEYLNAWNVELPSVDFSGETLEDDLGYGQSYRAQMVDRLHSDQSHSIRSEIVGRGRTSSRSRGRGYSESGYGGVHGHRNTTGIRSDDFGFARASLTLTAGPASANSPAIARQNTLRSVSPTRQVDRIGFRLRSPPRRERSPAQRATSPVRWGIRGGSTTRLGSRRKGSPGGPTFEEMIEKASKIEGTGAYGAGKGNGDGDVPPKPSETPPKTNNPTPAPRNTSSATSHRSPMVSRPQDPATPTRPATRTQLSVGPLASPGEFMDNAHKVWTSPSRRGNTDEAATSASDGAATAVKTTSNEGHARCHTRQPARAVVRPTQELESPTAKGKGKGREPCPPRESELRGSDYKQLYSQFPRVKPDVVRVFLNRSNGNLEDAKAELVKLQERYDASLSSLAKETAVCETNSSVSKVQNEPDLIDLIDAKSNAESPAITLASPTEKPMMNIMDDDSLIVFQAEPSRPKLAHLLDDDFPANVPIPLLKPTLASRSGNIPQKDAGDGIITTDNEVFSLSSQLASFSLSENVAPPGNTLRNSKMPIINKPASSTPSQNQTQATRVTSRSSTSTVFREPDLANSIWASENTNDSQSRDYGRRRK